MMTCPRQASMGCVKESFQKQSFSFRKLRTLKSDYDQKYTYNKQSCGAVV